MAEKTISINNPQVGMGGSYATGFEEIRGLNITDTPGVCYPNKALVKENDADIDALINLFKGYNDFAWGFSGSELWLQNEEDSWGMKTGHDANTIMAGFAWKDYTGIVQNGQISFYNSNHVYDNKITFFDTGTVYDVIVASDSKVYLLNYNFLQSLEEDIGETFDPADSRTYTPNKSALDFPEDQNPHTLLENDGKLWVVCDNVIFPWIKGEASYETPINTNRTINQAIAYNSTIYLQIGNKGEWYYINGDTIVSMNVRVPQHILANGAIKIYKPFMYDGLIHFGMGGAIGVNPQGVWTLNPFTGALNMAYLMSVGDDGTTTEYKFGHMTTDSDDGLLLTPWEDADGTSSYGVDRIGTTPYTGDKTFLVSRFLPVSRKLNAKAVDQLAIWLDSVLDSNSSVKVYYRKLRSDSWVQITRLSMTESDSHKSITKSIPLFTSGQFKIVLNYNAKFLLLQYDI